MKLRDYLTSHILLFVLHVFCMMLLSGFLYASGSSLPIIGIILAVWLFILFIYTCLEYYQRNRFFQKAKQVLETLDQRYLLGEMLPGSFRLEDQIYRDLIRRSNKSVIERIHMLEEEQKDYKDYIESWVHEIKAPITGIGLICENNKNETTKKILLENQRIENYVDMALYYARSENVYKDYMITETDLSQIVFETISKNRQYLMQNQIQLENNCSDLVFTDGKWIAFILNQLLLNSIKYRREQGAFIRFYTFRKEHSVCLVLEDNGIGIPPEDQKRIFEKGFTGVNGRTRGRSTGMGLYLCHKLCSRLGIAVYVNSLVNEYTKMILEFPVSSYLSKL